MAKQSERSDRWNKGKTEWSLIDFPSIECLAKVLMYGKTKYSKDNWKKGWYKQDLTDSLMRHTLAVLKGEEFDPEHGISHIGGVLFNAMAIEYCRLNNKFLDDLPQKRRSSRNTKSRTKGKNLSNKHKKAR
jgi:hypothetical protein